jgi:hypothetical protein
VHAFSPAPLPAQGPETGFPGQASAEESLAEKRPRRAGRLPWSTGRCPGRARRMVSVRPSRGTPAHRQQPPVSGPGPRGHRKALENHLLCGCQAISQTRSGEQRFASCLAGHRKPRWRPGRGLFDHSLAITGFRKRVQARDCLDVRQAGVQVRGSLGEHPLQYAGSDAQKNPGPEATALPGRYPEAYCPTRRGTTSTAALVSAAAFLRVPLLPAPSRYFSRTTTSFFNSSAPSGCW